MFPELDYKISERRAVIYIYFLFFLIKMPDRVPIFLNICQGNRIDVLKLLYIKPWFTLPLISLLVNEKWCWECYHGYDTLRFNHVNLLMKWHMKFTYKKR